MQERLLTVREVAEMLRLRPTTIRTWIREGKIRAIFLGSDSAGYRIPESEVRRILSQAKDRKGEHE